MITACIMTALLLAGAVPPMQVGVDDISIDAASRQGFAARGVHGGDGTTMVDYFRSSDKTSLSVEALTLAPTKDLQGALRMTTTTAEYLPDRPISLSSRPLGHRSVAFANGAAMYQQAMLDRHIVSVQMTCQQGEASRWSAAHWSQPDRVLIEGAVRHALARMAGRSLHAAPDATVNGHSITGVVSAEGGVRMAPLGGWATARRIELQRNDLAGTASFSINGKTVVLALACDKAKVGSQWKDLGGFLLRRGTTWYVPMDGIEAAVH